MTTKKIIIMSAAVGLLTCLAGTVADEFDRLEKEIELMRTEASIKYEEGYIDAYSSFVDSSQTIIVKDYARLKDVVQNSCGMTKIIVMRGGSLVMSDSVLNSNLCEGSQNKQDDNDTRPTIHIM